MLEAPIPDNEVERLHVLLALQILDTSPEERFDKITRSVQEWLNVPIVLASLIDQNRQWLKSCLGLSNSETPRNISFCGHAILHKRILNVPDAYLDPRFADNPLVLAAPYIRFYAGAPLATKDGFHIGTLSVISDKPRTLNARELQILRKLADGMQKEVNTVIYSQKPLTQEEQYSIKTLINPDSFRLRISSKGSNCR